MSIEGAVAVVGDGGGVGSTIPAAVLASSVGAEVGGVATKAVEAAATVLAARGVPNVGAAAVVGTLRIVSPAVCFAPHHAAVCGAVSAVPEVAAAPPVGAPGSAGQFSARVLRRHCQSGEQYYNSSDSGSHFLFSFWDVLERRSVCGLCTNKTSSLLIEEYKRV